MEDNTMGNNIEGYSTENNEHSSNIDLMEAQIFIEKNIQLIEQKTEELQQRNDEILEKEEVLEKTGGKIKRVSEKVTEYLGKNWRNLGRAAGIVSLLTSFVYLSGCTDKEHTLPTPQIMAFEPDEMPANVQPTPTITIEPTATEVPPEVDLTLSWELFEDLYGKTTEQLEEMEKGPYPDRPVYWIIRNDGGKGVIDYNRMSTYNEIELANLNMVEKYNKYLSLGLDEKGKEVLGKFLTFRSDEGDNLRLTIFIDGDGCPYDLDGAQTIIRKADNKKGFEAKVYSQEDIPWSEIPKEYWDDIEAGNTRIDFSGEEVVCSCNKNNVIEKFTK